MIHINLYVLHVSNYFKSTPCNSNLNSAFCCETRVQAQLCYLTIQVYVCIYGLYRKQAQAYLETTLYQGIFDQGVRVQMPFFQVHCV